MFIIIVAESSSPCFHVFSWCVCFHILPFKHTKWPGDRQTASKSQMLGDCQSRDSGKSQS